MASAKKTPKFVFEDPPPKREKRDWWAFADECRRNPGKWMLIQKDGPMSAAVVLRQGVKAIPWDEFEMQTSDNQNQKAPRTCTIHLRYVGKNKEYA